jgi:hypothetical protein
VGVLALIAFLGTGLYMRLHFPGAYEGREAVRYLYRANHLYLLFAALLNLGLGAYHTDAGTRRLRRLQMAASLLVLGAAPLLLAAFVFESPIVSPSRRITLTGAEAALAGTLLHVVCGVTQRRRSAI